MQHTRSHMLQVEYDQDSNDPSTDLRSENSSESYHLTFILNISMNITLDSITYQIRLSWKRFSKQTSISSLNIFYLGQNARLNGNNDVGFIVSDIVLVTV